MDERFERRRGPTATFQHRRCERPAIGRDRRRDVLSSAPSVNVMPASIGCGDPRKRIGAIAQSGWRATSADAGFQFARRTRRQPNV
jgi:hypothetical protein